MKHLTAILLCSVFAVLTGCTDSGTGSSGEGGSQTNSGDQVKIGPDQPSVEEMKHGLPPDQVRYLRERIQLKWKDQDLDCEEKTSDACLIVGGISLQMDLMDMGLDDHLTSAQKLGLIQELNLKALNIKELGHD